MRRLLLLFAFLLASPLSWAVAPYIHGERVAAGELTAVMTSVESKLTRAGFQVVGRHTPPGLPGHGVIVVTHDHRALDVFDRTLEMEDGRIKGESPPPS